MLAIGGGGGYYERGTPLHVLAPGYLSSSFRPVLQGYLADRTLHPPGTLHKGYAYGPMVALGGGGGLLRARYSCIEHVLAPGNLTGCVLGVSNLERCNTLHPNPA